MEVPTYTSEVVHPTADVSEPDSSSDNACDWVIPEYTSTPFMPASTQTEDVSSPDMSTEPLRRKHHVLRGERQAILSRQNKKFEANIARNVATLTEDTISDIRKMDDSTQPGSTIEINNTVDDDDEGVIFGEDNDENEGYLFADEDTNEDFEIDGTQDQSIATNVPDPYDKVYSNIPEETHMLKHVPNCGYCTAKKFEYESPRFCCRGGKVELAPLETPPQLRRLWDSADSDARHFRDNIRFFNGHFSFTSLYCCLDSMTTNMRDSGIYTFCAQGMMYHNIKSFGSECGAEHKLLELYFYDDDPSLEHRYQVNLDGMQISQRLVYPWTKWMHTGRRIGQVMQMMKMWICPGVFNPILHGKRLFQQFAVDTYIKIESSRLDFICKNQDQLRADLYQGLVDIMLDGDVRAEKVGKRTVLSALFIGGPRDMRRRYMDDMALVQKFGKPDIFLTMTCNPNWDEIRRELLPDRHRKIVGSCSDILGKVRAYVYVVEFQKRGFPHAHFLLIMQRKYKLTCPEQYDLLISAEIPSNKYPELRKMVIKHMMHGPCGSLNPNCPCTKGHASCKNQYPWHFREATLQGKDSYPNYKRHDDGRKEKVQGCELDNRWVVPYNPYLLQLFNYHINVEACGRIKAVKYLFKYIYKGHDRASVVMRDASKENDDVDEIQQYRDARWVTPSEALWRIYGFELSQNSPSLMQLQLHLPNMHMVTFHERQMVERVVNRPGADRSMITTYFEANKLHKEARCILYRDFPEWCTWQQGKVWQRRKRNTGGQVGRIISALPSEGEHFYLWLLLNHVAGATSYADLRTVDGDTLPLFRESMGKDIKTFPLPAIIDRYDDSQGIDREIYEEESIEATTEDVALQETLNEEQKSAYEKILSVVDTSNGGVFFVDGPGGTGNTYLYKALLAVLRSQDKIAVAIATSRVAASIMPGGRTAHSRFKIPLTIDDGAICTFTKQSGTSKLLQKASLIIWDEASMAKRQSIEALHNSMCDIMGRLLVRNMRAKSDPWFAEYLLCVGGGTEEVNNDGDVRLLDEHAGMRVFLPRIPLCPSDDEMFPFHFKRKQFPVRLSFAMTVNKSQGQTIPNVVVYLPEPVFSHGQVYVALSRATTRFNVKILVIPVTDEKMKKGMQKKSTINGVTYTKNIVYKEVLTP
ncbi:hypothetical protein ZEAMMB73_Zm00001d041806 [Zea mays]|uniref:ATP-dependent DNA helicase n=1 Tax=Zea mays TaxID=4577 RepID=A0A1D6MYF4_MAIZE|nr:hypothetical protein ZEAMMB73_Zm00001d041806 [Zea mays]